MSIFLDKLKSFKDTTQKRIDAVVADPVLVETRLNTCMTCENYIKLTSQCKKCGCFMGVKAKIKGATCPINLW